MEGEGQIDYIAQNGIQISFGAKAKLDGNIVFEQLVHAAQGHRLRPPAVQGRGRKCL